MKTPRLLQRLSKTSNPHDTLETAFAFNTKVRMVHSRPNEPWTVILYFSRPRMKHVKPSHVLFSLIIAVGRGKT